MVENIHLRPVWMADSRARGRMDGYVDLPYSVMD
jgi:hypothetical protein